MTDPIPMPGFDPWTDETSHLIGADLAQLFADVKDFNRNVIRASLPGSAAKVAHEAVEFAADPSLDEAADILITVLGWLYLSGHDIDEWIDAALVKMAVNRRRTWTKLPDGTWQHD